MKQKKELPGWKQKQMLKVAVVVVAVVLVPVRVLVADKDAVQPVDQVVATGDQVVRGDKNPVPKGNLGVIFSFDSIVL
jgi:hypothetical protein